ncbi:MAG: NAD-dependent dehydratase [Thermomonas sp.]
MNILHIGATGLVGGLVLTRLLDAPQVTRVVAPTRRPLEIRRPALLNPVVDFEALPADADWWAVDAVICTLGTTMADAGSKPAFRRVDHDYPLMVARIARQAGAQIYALNSAMGANPRSSIFYNQVKGELEDALAGLGYPSLALVRPGLIDGVRRHPRQGEGRALAVSRLLRPLLPMRFRPSRAGRIADALVEAALHPRPGIHRVEADALA